MTDTSAFSLALDTNSPGWNGWTIVNVFEVAGLTLPAGSITHVRATFQKAVSEGYSIGSCYVGHKASSGDAYDFASTPTQMLFGGSGSKTVTTTADEVTDWIEFVYNKTSGLTFAWYINSAVDSLIYKGGQTTRQMWYKGANEPSTVNKTGFTNAGVENQTFCISKIEVRSVDGGTSKIFAVYF